ncbi:hypothetical protein CVT24_008045 [Panaeolus cyanescens]|uniref:MOCS2A n=1 Tax=Panaeolus cyanescens TaxID=181874 RepID=A0A409YQQ1_9AGAR|nr:hypothetical protein CVT24_008045 [Panaeolus cyanescens]
MTTTLEAPTITILYFAASSTATNLSSESISIPSSGLPLNSLPSLLISRHPESPNLKDILKDVKWSIDLEMVDEGDEENIILKGGEEVGVICPVSGG